jgi:protease IV
MFARRHPYLFFILVFASVVSAAALGLGLIVLIGLKGSAPERGDRVGVVEIKGVISDSRDVVENLKRFREDDAIKAIVVRIDSPGGAVAPAQEIFREIRKTADTKKVIASMGTVAASGGYYTAAAADGIVANPGTITGSIGVIMGFTNLQELFERIGLSPFVIKSGDYKDIGSPLREMEPHERKLLQDLADRIKDQFVQAICEGRNMNPGEVEPIVDGRIFSGEEAMRIGLVDRLGNLQDAVDWAGELGGISGKIEVVYAPEKRFPLLRYFFDSSLDQIIHHFSSPLFLYSAGRLK